MQPHLRGPAHLSLVAGTLGLGALCLVYGTFPPQWQPVPPGLPWPRAYAYASGVVLVGAGAGLLTPRFAPRAALAAMLYDLVWVAAETLRTAPTVTSLARLLGLFEAVSEGLAAFAGCLALHAAITGGRRGAGAARTLLGGACVAFGLSHFAYAEFTGGMIPPWLPARTELAYLTGVFHIAAGLGLLTGVLARLAATLEALMLGGFVLLVHLPSFASSPKWAPTRQVQGTELCLSLLIAGAAGVVARSLRDRPWGALRPATRP